MAPGKELVRREYSIKGRIERLGRHMASRQMWAFAKKWKRGGHWVGGVEAGDRRKEGWELAGSCTDVCS